MEIPEFLNDFRIYRNGHHTVGVADLQLPSLESMKQTVSGAGVAGEYESSVIGHLQSSKLTINWKTLNGSSAAYMEPKVVQYDCRGANQVYDPKLGAHSIEKVRVVIHGTSGKLDLGKMKKGEAYETSTEVEVLYLKVEVAGKVKLEIDKPNYKFVLNGVDYLKDVKEALGL
ncbi:phage major tail tube protein [Niallia sp. 01092]|uniref:phage major tail tube protein n=1 Tax=unclassified Niallia TaxID=2837522 RepID=UPI003FD1E795